jgi:hypothetical protein
VQEQVLCAMEVGAPTLGIGVRMNLTFGCMMGDATLGNVGRTLGALRGLCGSIAGREGGLWLGKAVGLMVCCVGVRKATGVKCLLARMRQYGGVKEWQWQWCVAPPTN